MHKFFIPEVGSIVIEMKRSNKRSLKAVFILSIVVLVSLLATLRFAGILQEPVRDNITLEIIEWEIKRPNQTVTLEDALKSSYSNSEMSTMMCVMIGTYSNDDPAFASDFVTIEVITNATTTTINSFVDSVYIVLHKDCQSTVDWISTEFYFENLSLIDQAQGYIQNTKAYISLKSLNHSNEVYLSAAAQWLLFTPNNQSHQLDVFFELTFHNGTSYKKVIQPFQLEILGDKENE